MLQPPPALARLLSRVRHAVHNLTLRAVPPPIALLDMISAAWLSQAIVAAAQLRLPDAVASAARSADEIAVRTGLSADGVRRLMRALAQHGVFEELDDGRFRATPLSDALRADRPDSIRDFALFLGSRAHREHWSELARAVATGQSAVPALRGGEFFAYAREDAAFGALFASAMSSLSELACPALLDAIELSDQSSVCDVGGGEGRLLEGILMRHTGLRGVLFDQPEVVNRAHPIPASLHTRLYRVGGSFFEAWPESHDVYLLKHILHDWDDVLARRILARAREALVPRRGGRLLVIEMVVPKRSAPHVSKVIDLEMLLSVGGRERTEREFRQLLAQEGFRLQRVVPTAAPLSILEASL